MATYAKLIYNGRIQTVALIDGISPEEVSNLLKTVFGISGSIVGFMAEVDSFVAIVDTDLDFNFQITERTRDPAFTGVQAAISNSSLGSM